MGEGSAECNRPLLQQRWKNDSSVFEATEIPLRTLYIHNCYSVKGINIYFVSSSLGSDDESLDGDAQLDSMHLSTVVKGYLTKTFILITHKVRPFYPFNHLFLFLSLPVYSVRIYAGTGFVCLSSLDLAFSNPLL